MIKKSHAYNRPPRMQRKGGNCLKQIGEVQNIADSVKKQAIFLLEKMVYSR